MGLFMSSGGIGKHRLCLINTTYLVSKQVNRKLWGANPHLLINYGEKYVTRIQAGCAIIQFRLES